MFLTISTVALSLVSVLATNTSCPTWFYYNNSTAQQCHCGHGLLCSSNKTVEIKDGVCATSAGEGLVGANVDMDCCTDIYLYSFSVPPASVCVG